MTGLSSPGAALLKIQCSKDCSSNFRSKKSTNTVPCLLRNLLEQSLEGCRLCFKI